MPNLRLKYQNKPQKYVWSSQEEEEEQKALLDKGVQLQEKI